MGAMKRYLGLLTLLFLAPFTLSAGDDAYSVQFDGEIQRKVRSQLEQASSCISLQKKKLPSSHVLRGRIEKDLEKFEEIAKANGFYSAHVTSEVRHGASPEVLFHFDMGPQYTLESFDIVDAEGKLTLDDLPVRQGLPITSQAILDAEKAVILKLKSQGYAAAGVLSREIFADVSKHVLTVHLQVEKGPLITFGALNIQGLKTVDPSVITKQLSWNAGDRYDPEKIIKTQQQIEKTGLFSSVQIIEDQTNIQNDTLPVDLQLEESKHRSVGAGIAYTTTFGPGIRAEWENRNFRGLGEKLQLRTELWRKNQVALISLTQPDFHTKDQTLTWLIEYDKLHTIAFDSLSYNGSALVQRRLSRETEIGCGIRAEWLDSRNCEGGHQYYLVKAPLQFKWSNADNLLDPTRGHTVNIKLTPTAQLHLPPYFYTWHMTALSAYHSLFENHLTIASKVVFGNIIGASRHTIPPPDRFYGGSENVLRGYRAYSVSPLHDKKTPIGGRSLLAATLEARFRTSGEMGYALFYDVGNVYTANFPEPKGPLLHSVGAGIRYTTPIGPLRLDVAVPLHRRKALDPNFQIYFSIGQSF